MNYFIFDGESSLDYGVYIGGQNTFNAPQRDVSKVAIPGRNGDLVQDNGRFLNVQVPYNIVVMDDFRDKTDAIKAWLLSKKGYCKLVDTYHPGTYRMARVAGGINFETAAYNSTGRTQVIFDCKPERFLDSGDDVFQVGVWGQTESASGSVVSFEGEEDEAVKSIAASITPTQDLHGYDYPWPAGGGKNIFDYTRLQSDDGLTVTIAQTGTVSISGLPTRETVFLCRYDITDLLQDGTYTLSQSQFFGAQLYSEVLSRNKDGTISYYGCANVLSRNIPVDKSLVDAYEIYVVARKSAWGEESKTFSCTFQLEKGSTATTYAPYSNICPIAGRTEATVWRTGKNLLADTNFKDSFFVNGVTFTRVSGGHYKASGTCNPAAWLLCMNTIVDRHNIPVSLPTGTYTLSSGNPKIRCYVYRGEGYSDYVQQTESVTSQNMPVTGVRYLINAGATFDDDDIYLQLVDGSVAIPYEPYSGTSYPVSWQSEAGTVYGGTVDVVSGTLTVDKAEIVFNGSERWTPYGKEGYYLPLNTMEKKLQNYEGAILCDKLPTFRSSYVKDYQDAAYGITGWSNTSSAGNNYIYIKGGEIEATSAGTIKAWLAENPIQVVYALATPQTYQLSEEEIEVLIGTNNVWADSGDVNVKWSINPHILRNPTRFASRPKIRVKGSGNGTLTIENGVIVVNNLNEYVDIDSELMNCYKGTENKNADVELPNHEYPTLHSGSNRVDFSGNITAVEVQGRWWTI